jgi:hypothetical protein
VSRARGRQAVGDAEEVDGARFAVVAGVDRRARLLVGGQRAINARDRGFELAPAVLVGEQL